MAQARPAGPPPTMATPTSIRSPGGSVGAAMNSSMGLTGGGYALGATLFMNGWYQSVLASTGGLPGHDLAGGASSAAR